MLTTVYSRESNVAQVYSVGVLLIFGDPPPPAIRYAAICAVVPSVADLLHIAVIGFRDVGKI